MDKTNACPIQSLDQLNNVRLGLVLHRYHANKNLMTLHLKATIHVGYVVFFIVGEEQRIGTD